MATETNVIIWMAQGRALPQNSCPLQWYGWPGALPEHSGAGLIYKNVEVNSIVTGTITRPQLVDSPGSRWR